MSEATIEQVVENEKLTKEQRLERFIAMRKEISKHQPKGRSQTIKAAIQKERSKEAGLSANLLCNLLRSFGANVVIEHTKAPKLDIPQGVSCFGEREIFENIWFNEEDEHPHFGNLPEIDELYIGAQKSSGYTVAKVVFPIDNEQLELEGSIEEMEKELNKHLITVYGKSICSANEVFNGNIGAWFALMDALYLFSQKNIDSPINHLFSFAVSLLPISLDIPSHYFDHLNLIALE